MAPNDVYGSGPSASWRRDDQPRCGSENTDLAHAGPTYLYSGGVARQQQVTTGEGASSPEPNVPFGEFVSTNRRRLTEALSYRWSNHKDVEDAVQEALVLANDQWGDVGVMARPDAWVFKVAHRHLCRWSSQDQLHDTIAQVAGPNVARDESAPDHGEQQCDRA